MRYNIYTESERRETMQKESSDKELLDALACYISECGDSKGGKAKNEGRIPNISGLCRYLKVGKNELLARLAQQPVLADRVFTVLEDEAINSASSSGVFAQYMKMLDEVRSSLDGGDSDDDKLTVIFPHPDGEEQDT